MLVILERSRLREHNENSPVREEKWTGAWNVLRNEQNIPTTPQAEKQQTTASYRDSNTEASATQTFSSGLCLSAQTLIPPSDLVPSFK